MASYSNSFAKEHLKDVEGGKVNMIGSCNAGTITTNLSGMYGLISVWYNPDGVVDILFTEAFNGMGYMPFYNGMNWLLLHPQVRSSSLRHKKRGSARVCPTLIYASTVKELLRSRPSKEILRARGS